LTDEPGGPGTPHIAPRALSKRGLLHEIGVFPDVVALNGDCRICSQSKCSKNIYLFSFREICLKFKIVPIWIGFRNLKQKQIQTFFKKRDVIEKNISRRFVIMIDCWICSLFLNKLIESWWCFCSLKWNLSAMLNLPNKI
jgi:hypothetical protein